MGSKKKTRARRSTTKNQAAAAASSSVPAAIQSPPPGFRNDAEFRGKSAAATSGKETSCISLRLSSQEQNQAQLRLAPDSASNPIRMDGIVPSVGSRSPSGQVRSYTRREREVFALSRGAIQNTLEAARLIRDTRQRPREAGTGDVEVAADGFIRLLGLQVFPDIISSLSRMGELAKEKMDRGTIQAIRDAVKEMKNTLAVYDAAKEILRVRKANRQQSGGTNAAGSSRDSCGDDEKGPDGSGGDRIVD